MLENLISKKAKAVQYTPTSAYYLDDKGRTDELDIERRERNDIIINLDKNLDMDILCEELIHKTDVSDISLEQLLQISEDETKRFEHSIGKYIDFIKDTFANIEETYTEYPRGTFHAEYKRLNISEFINDETKFSRELDETIDTSEKYKRVEEHCLNMIYRLRKDWYGMYTSIVKKKHVEREITKMILNIRNFRYADNIKNMNDIYLRLLSVDTTTLNTITVLNNNTQNAAKTLELTDVTLINKKMLYDLYNMINDPIITLTYKNAYKKTIEDFPNWGDNAELKEYDPTEYNRRLDSRLKSLKSSIIPVAYSTYNGVRPSEDLGDFEFWNGFQSFDLDIKECADREDVNGKKVLKNYHYTKEDVEVMKNKIHNTLKKYSWYLCTKTSISGLGLHVLTKVRPMHHLFKGESDNNLINKFWFVMNYYHKYTIIKWILLNECGIDEKFINLVIDAAMAKISQGIVLNSDTKSLWNDTFMDLPLIYGMHIPPKDGIESDEWILKKSNLKRLLTSKNLQAVGHETLKGAKNKRKQHVVDLKPKYDTISYEFSSVEMPNLEDVLQVDESKFQSGARDNMRHKLIRTVIYIYGVSEESKNLCRHLLKTETVWSEHEFGGKWNYAYKKPFAFTDMLALLKACGCIFDISKNVLKEVKDTKLHKAIESLRDSTIDFSEIMPHYSFTIDKKNPYLGSIKDKIVDSLAVDKVNVIESSPGTGKTTLFNMLAKDYRVCLVCPYQSVLKNKVEGDLVANRYFKTYYGGKKIKNITGSIATTYDTFLQMNEDDYKKFDLIAIDESHLLFTETYRGSVPSNVANGVSKFVANEMAKKESMRFDIGMTNTYGSIMDNTMLSKTMSNTGTKLVMMTGTITGELLYFKRTDNLNFIKINSKHKYGKHVNMVLCDSAKNVQFTIAQTIANAIDSNKTVIVPTNKGDVYINSLLSQVRHMSKKGVEDDEWGYYSKATLGSKICQSINEESKLLPNTKLLFCTRYLGVGVDILNERDFMVVINGDDTTASDIEQFNNRIRRSYIDCTIVYNALVQNVSGLMEIKKSVYDSPNEIELKNYRDFEREVGDDFKIAMANRKVSEKDEFGRFKLHEHMSLNEIYHDITSDGVKFNEDKFLIRGFAEDFNKISKGSAYTKYVLSAYYDYDIDYKVSFMDSEELKSKLDSVALMSKRKTIATKSEAFLETIDFCVKNWEKIENRNIIDFELLSEKDFKLLIEPSDKTVVGKEKYEYCIKYSSTFEKQFKSAYSKMRKLLKLYDGETAASILKKNVSDSGRINNAEISRDMRLIDFMKQNKNGGLLVAASDIFTIVEQFICDDMNLVEVHSPTKISMEDFVMRDLKVSLNKYAERYYASISESSTLQSLKRREEMFDKTDETIKTLFKTRRNKEGIYNLTYRNIPRFSDSEDINTNLKDDIIEKYLRGHVKISSKIDLTVDINETESRDIETYGKSVENDMSNYSF